MSECHSNACMKDTNKNSEKLTVEPFMPGHEGTPQLVARFVRQILKVLFAPLAKFVFHLLGATRVSLRTYSKVLTCETHRKTQVLHSASAPSLTSVAQDE